jgi:hypothetical protein
VLWATIGTGDDGSGLPATTVVPGEAAAGSEPASPTSAATAGPVTISSIAAWDPYGTNGSENDAQAPLALADGSGATSWSTECYSSQYMGGKQGVGLIVTLSAAAAGRLQLESVNAPYAVEVYASAEATPPTALEGWGAPVGEKAYSTSPGVVEASVATPAAHLLVWLTELGPDSGCSSANPYRGRLAEITFAA